MPRPRVVRAEAWYENETAGLGDRFVAAVEATVMRGSRWPNAGKPVVIALDGAVVNRKLPVGGFPWAVGYEVTDEKLFVLAVFHQHRLDGGVATGQGSTRRYTSPSANGRSPR